MKILSALGLAVFFIVLRWGVITGPLMRDEGEYAYSAWLLGQNILPYANAFIQKPPLIIYTYLTAQLINPDCYWLPRIFASISVLLATALAGLISRFEFGKGAGMSAAWIMTPLVLMPNLMGIFANPEPFILFPMMAVFGCYVIKKGHAPRPHWFAAGIFSAIAVLYKPTVLPILMYLFAAWSVQTWFCSRDAAKVIKNIFFGLGGIAATSILLVGYFFMRDNASSLWECVVAYNRYYAVNFQSPGQKLNAFVVYLKLLWSSWRVLFILAASFFIMRPPRWLFYLGLLTVAFLASCGSPHAHYYIFVGPFLAIVASAAIKVLADRSSQRLPGAFSAKFVRVTLTVVVVALVSSEVIANRAEATAALSPWGHPYCGNPVKESIIAAQRVARLTQRSGGSVFIAGSEPQILYYAKRKSPTRFITMYPLMINTKIASSYQDEAIRDLGINKPDAVIFVTSHYSWLRNEDSPRLMFDFLQRFLQRDYDPIGGFGLSGGAAYLHEPLSKDSMKDYSLILYRRKGLQE